MNTTNTLEGCSYPSLASSSAYSRGCRCEDCKQYQRDYYASRKEAALASSTERHERLQNDPEYRARRTVAASRHNAAKRNHLPIAATWQEVMELQQSTSTCQACGCTPSSTLHTDHCHSTGALRGMLCQECNHKDALNGN